MKNVNSKCWEIDRDTPLGQISASYDVGKAVDKSVEWKKKVLETFWKITLFCISQLSVDEIDQIFFYSSRNEISNPDFQTACLYLFGKYANSRNRPRTDGK